VKTAISIPDATFDAAELAARRLDMSRSQLYARAVAAYIEAHRADGVTEMLDRVYAGSDSRIDAVLGGMQAASQPVRDW